MTDFQAEGLLTQAGLCPAWSTSRGSAYWPIKGANNGIGLCNGKILRHLNRRKPKEIALSELQTLLTEIKP